MNAYKLTSSLVTLSLILLVAPSKKSLARVIQSIKPDDTITKCAILDHQSGYIFKPHCKEEMHRSGINYTVNYNSLGLRDKEFSSPPPKNTKRILFIGASRVMGPGLKIENTIPKQLEKLLKKKRLNVEVINAGVEGYSAIHFYTKIEDWIKAYSPTHIIFHLDDITKTVLRDNSMSLYFQEKDGNPSIDVSFSSESSKKIEFLRKTFPRLFDIDPYKKIYTLKTIGHLCLRIAACRIRHPFNNDDAVFCLQNQTANFLEKIDKVIRSHNIKSLYLYKADAPFNTDLIVGPEYDLAIASFLNMFIFDIKSDTSEKLISFLRTKGLHLEGYHMNDSKNENFLPMDYHFSQQGALEYALSIYPFVLKQLILPK